MNDISLNSKRAYEDECLNYLRYLKAYQKIDTTNSDLVNKISLIFSNLHENFMSTQVSKSPIKFPVF